jgi:uncharacterized protein involved in cysteine biosynthesis
MATSSPTPLRYHDPDQGGVLTRFFAGASFVASSVGFAMTRPAVLKWTLVPMLVQTVLFIAVVGTGWSRLDQLVDRFGPEPGHWYSFVGSLLFVGLAVALVLGGLLFTLLAGSVICDPFFDLIGEAVEHAHLGRTAGPPFSLTGVLPGMARELVASMSRLLVFLVVAVPLWLLGLTGVGSVVAAPLGLAWTWAFVALEAVSRSQARHQLAVKGRISTVARQTTVTLGFGAAGWLASFVPLTAPLLVVAGTRMYLALAAWDRVPSALTDDEKRGLRA